MHRIDSIGTVTVMPPPTTGGAQGFYSDGDPETGKQGTVASAEHMNAIQEEIVAVILAAGLVLSKADHAQLLQAIRALLVQQTDQLSEAAKSGRYEDLIGLPKFAQVATTGDYNHLLNRPAIPAPVTPDWNTLANRPNLTPGGYQYVGAFSGSFSETNTTGKTVVYYFNGGSSPSAGGNSVNRIHLSGAVNGAEVASFINANDAFSKSGSLSILCPPGATVSCASYPFEAGAGSFSVYRCVGPFF